MKHIIPTITLTALAAAASAQQAAAPAGLNYNQVGISRTNANNVVSAQFNPAGSNFVIGFVAANDHNSADDSNGQINLGYVFRGVTQGIDATVGLAQNGEEDTAYTLTLRRTLNEVYQGLEITAGIASLLTSSNEFGQDFTFGGVNGNDNKSIRFIEVAYNVTKTLQVAVGLTEQSDNEEVNTHTVFSVRAGF